MSVTTYSKSYLIGWAPLILLLLAPIVDFIDVDGLHVAAIIVLVVLGYFVLRFAERTYKKSFPIYIEENTVARLHGRAVVIFSVISVIGCQLVLQQQQNFLGIASFDNLQERYIALVEASLQGNSTSSIWSTIGNLSRAFFFIAITSYVATSVQKRSIWSKLLLGSILVTALVQNFLVNVSRLQLIFFLLCGGIAAVLIHHPFLRRKVPIVGLIFILVTFLVATTTQRLNAMFDSAELVANYMMQFFGVQLKFIGRLLLDNLGIAFFTLCMYISQAIPEGIRLITQNDSPYSLGGHSFYLLLAPLLRLFDVQLGVGNSVISNQGAWWGLIGDLYIDFGIFFPFIYLIILYALVRIAIRYGDGPVYGLALRTITAGMLFIAPYIGVFNTYAVSYFAITVLAIGEHRRLRHYQ